MRPAEWANGALDAERIRARMLSTGRAARDLAADRGPTWDSAGLRAEYEVLGFAAPFVVVRRRSDGAVGSLEFTHQPRVYFGWKEDRP
jgi:hypothetical protein